ncbi:molybdopterin-guanine dinucleotide biosynthesis protein B [Promethearchaeum syntrophicum]|uniref:Molybdopterin-guanine dinucleotide biosynthesis protein B n=1 Tax=Promethearchaeum syntrophicum TaxID=2594042 RepID=A0A5B9DG47_9ARCH
MMRDNEKKNKARNYSESYNQFQIISFIGFSKSGKTASIERLISFLHTQNYIILAFKHIHQENFSIDTPGKNTWKYSRAGADVVVSQSPNESAILFNRKIDPLIMIKSIIDLIQSSLKADQTSFDKKVIVILEGFRDIKVKKILCVKNLEEIKSQIEPSIVAIAGSIFSNVSELKNAKTEKFVKFINVLENPEEILKIYGI